MTPTIEEAEDWAAEYWMFTVPCKDPKESTCTVFGGDGDGVACCYGNLGNFDLPTDAIDTAEYIAVLLNAAADRGRARK